MTHVLLFSEKHQQLGEFFFYEGALERSVVTPCGESLCGEEIGLWRVAGIALQKRSDRTLDQGGVTSDHLSTHVSIRSADAAEAVRIWARQHSYETIDIPPRLLPLWESLAHLDLADEERYGSFFAIRHASHRHVLAWQQAIQEVMKKSTYLSAAV